MTKQFNSPVKATGLARLGRAAILGTALASLAACNGMYGAKQPTGEGIGYHDARYQEIAAMREYRACRDEALELDAQARQTKSAAKYIASAKLIDGCEANLGPEARGVAVVERMRAYGLSIQNYLKGGEIANAQNNFERFQQEFAGKDLYYADGSSFTETMSALLSREETTSYGQFSLLNVNSDLKAEMRRVNYWQQN
ncbi:hypothetical protein [Aestuariispira insulae]|uniref:Lipoprotein n=1 Tax=Aestuariispira insulae TaxID=1461337 RepID=A0A3D9HXC0_9PROT|nr:hypothetical protein [Aestuariispira insulae]RED53546.1 hypothetical protein DFP90_101337 [Aestuariispira insulae]